MFGLGRSTSNGKVGRAAKPGETVNRRATPVTTPAKGKRAVGSKPRRTDKPAS